MLDAGARVIHVDVMDGHFVPPITMGPLVVAALRERIGAAGALLEVHLMIERPERQIAEFARAGADVITLHAEATPHVDYALSHDPRCRARGRARGVPVDAARGLRRGCRQGRPGALHDRQPGLGRPDASSRPRSAGSSGAEPLLREGVAIEVDGGIEVGHGRRAARAAGATRSSPARAVFGASDPAAAYVALAEAVGDPRR